MGAVSDLAFDFSSGSLDWVNVAVPVAFGFVFAGLGTVLPLIRSFRKEQHRNELEIERVREVLPAADELISYSQIRERLRADVDAATAAAVGVDIKEIRSEDIEITDVRPGGKPVGVTENVGGVRITDVRASGGITISEMPVDDREDTSGQGAGRKSIQFRTTSSPGCCVVWSPAWRATSRSITCCPWVNGSRYTSVAPARPFSLT